MEITILLEYSDRSQLRAWHSVSPLAARKVIGLNSTWNAASILKLVG